MVQRWDGRVLLGFSAHTALGTEAVAAGEPLILQFSCSHERDDCGYSPQDPWKSQSWQCWLSLLGKGG